jgi:hypothetical protein
MHTEGNDPGKPEGTSVHGAPESAGVGYEVTDVRVGGIAVFLAGLFGFVLIFFVFCFGMGKVINNLWAKQDGAPTKWRTPLGIAEPAGVKGKDLESNAELQQQELQRMTANFPEPRLDIDDGNQATADLHAREDLLLDHYSSVTNAPGTIRIPIDRAMELIAQRGLATSENATRTPGQKLAEAGGPVVQAPLTTGFARTGYELVTIEARKQKLDFGKAEAESHAEVSPAH